MRIYIYGNSSATLPVYHCDWQMFASSSYIHSYTMMVKNALNFFVISKDHASLQKIAIRAQNDRNMLGDFCSLQLFCRFAIFFHGVSEQFSASFSRITCDKRNQLSDLQSTSSRDSLSTGGLAASEVRGNEAS